MSICNFLDRRSAELHGVFPQLNYDVCETIVKYEWYLYYDMDYDAVDYFIEWFYKNIKIINKFHFDLTQWRNDIITYKETDYLILTDEACNSKCEDILVDRFNEELEDVSDYLRDYFDMDTAIVNAIETDGYEHILGYNQLNEVNDIYGDYYIFEYY